MNENRFSCLALVLIVLGVFLFSWIVVPAYNRVAREAEAFWAQTRPVDETPVQVPTGQPAGANTQNTAVQATPRTATVQDRVAFSRRLEVPISNKKNSLYPHNGVLLQHMLAFYDQDLTFTADSQYELDIQTNNFSRINSDNPESWQSLNVNLRHDDSLDSLFIVDITMQGSYIHTVALPRQPNMVDRAFRITYERELNAHLNDLANYLADRLSLYGDEFTRW